MSGKHHTPKDVRDILRRMPGWRFDGYTQRGGLRFRHVSGAAITAGRDFNAKHTLQNILAEARRYERKAAQKTS